MYTSICVLMYLYYIYLLISAMMDLLSDEVHIVIVICLKFYMNFDGTILSFYTWICVVHCVHQDKCLKTLHYLNIKT